MTDSEKIAELQHQLTEVVVEKVKLEAQLKKMKGTSQMDLLKVSTQNSAFIHEVIGQLEPFTGVIGDLEHFLKGGDQIMGLIKSRKENDTLIESDVVLLEASLVSRISRRVLNAIQGDTSLAWDTLKVKLKKLYGGGRWSPEEDTFYLFKERRKSGTSEGEFAEKLLVLHNRLVEKSVETYGQAEGAQRMEFIRGILKVQLNHYIDVPGSLPRDKDFLSCAHELIDARERKQSRFQNTEEQWTEVKSPRKKYRTPGHRSGERFSDKRYKREPDERRKKHERRCYECNQLGHLAAQCNFTKCYECGRQGHYARECPKRISRSKRRGSHPGRIEVNNQKCDRKRIHGSSGGNSSSGESSGEESSPSERSYPSPRGHEVRSGNTYRGGPSGSEEVARQPRSD